MMKHRCARLTLVLGLPAVLAIACSGSSTLPPTTLQDTGGSATGQGGFPNGQGGAAATSSGGTTPVVGSSGGTGTTPSFGGYPANFGGYPTTTTGGVPTTNTGGSGNTGTGSLNVIAGGYVQGTGYKGYAWTAATGTGSSITPVDFSATVTASQLCASGTVGFMSDYSGVGILGVNLNQEATGTNPPTNPYTPTGSGVTVNVTNPGGSVVRIQIQAPDGNTRWCYTLTTFGSSTTIPWSSFSTTCWNTTGTAYTAGTALAQVMVLVPGGNAAAVTFSICLNSLSI